MTFRQWDALAGKLPLTRRTPIHPVQDSQENHSGDGWRLLHGDSLDVLAELPDQCIDALISDPPYGISFKGNRWDGTSIRESAAHRTRRRLTPGQAFAAWAQTWATEAHRVLKPGGHALAFGSPRTFHRLACGFEDAGLELRDTLAWLYGTGVPKSRKLPDGRATALKPAWEPIVIARRPFDGSTVTNIEQHGTGALNIDACRVAGRHPANVALAHKPACTEQRCAPGCAVLAVDAAADATRAAAPSVMRASRIFYAAKASRNERDAGCEHLPAEALDIFPNTGRKRSARPARNRHPTVKPLSLMRWLVRLACPPGGIVLDPFCGSGTTGCAAVLEDRLFLGIEIDAGYLDVATARITHWSRQEADDPRPFDHRDTRRKR